MDADMTSSQNGPDQTREYRTRGGDRVIINNFNPKNALGNTVSFPISGQVINKDKPRTRRRVLWSLEGRCLPLRLSEHDIIDLPPVLLSPAPHCADCDGQHIRPPKAR